MLLIQPSSAPLIEGSRTGSGSTGEADAAANELYADYARWGRLGWGVLAYLMVVLGLVCLGVILDLVDVIQRVDEAVVFAAVGIGGAGLAAAGGIMLHRLWRSGRALSRAIAWWLRLPYRLGERQRHFSGYAAPRVAIYKPPLLVRIVLSALTFLVGVMGVSTLAFPGRSEMPATTVIFVVLGVLSLLCAGGQMSGVMRIISGVGEQDPLWGRIRPHVVMPTRR